MNFGFAFNVAGTDCKQILRPLIDDALVIVENEVVNVGRGPLSQLIRKLKQLRVPYDRPT